MINFDFYYCSDKEIMVQTRCKWLPDCFKMPVRIKDEELQNYKARTTKQVLFMLAEKMLYQRLQNYNHSGTENDFQFKALQEARQELERIRNAQYDLFMMVYKSKIIKTFHIVIPPFDSPLHDTFNQKIQDIEKYLKAIEHE